MEIGKILENFREKGFKPFYFDSSGKLKDFLLNEISGTTVGMGGSMTIQELDIYNLLSQNNKVYSHSVCSAYIKNPLEICAENRSRNAVSPAVYIDNLPGFRQGVCAQNI